MKQGLWTGVLVLLGVFGWGALVRAAPVGTAFTYQGQLKQGGMPVNGTALMVFSLWDAATNGIQIGGNITNAGVPIVNGLFTVTLDFGSVPFTGSARWLQVAVNGQTLAPRQPIMAAPYAVRALDAPHGHSLDAVDGSPVDAVYVDAAGKVGIGTTAPSANLTISGGLWAYDGASQGVVLTSSLFHFARLSNEDTIYEYDDANGMHSFFSGGSPSLSILDDGRVGIGTTSPSARVQVAGNTQMILHLSSSNTGGTWANIVNSSTGGKDWNIISTGSTNGEGAGHLLMRNGTIGVVMTLTGDGWALLRGGLNMDTINSNAGNTSAGALRFGFGSGEAIASKRNAGGNQYGLDFYTGFAQRLSITNGGYVGIGLTNPSVRLEVAGAGDTEFGVMSTDSGGRLWTLQSSRVNGGPLDGTFQIIDRSAGASRMTITPGGNVGVGTTAPQALLDVNGRTRTKSLEIVGGADLAEPFEIRSDEPEGNEATRQQGKETDPGTVVVIDPEHPGALRVSREPHDAKVAGIISGAKGLAPGMVLRSEGTALADGTHLVAMSGRVWCKCDASSGPIRAGDLLTTSAMPGHAMRVAADAELPRGAILGKAMTELTEGTGLVLVLVNLQ